MSIREIFSNIISFPVTNGSDKDTVMQISTVLGHVYHIPIDASSETGLLRHFSYYVFGVRNYENTKSMRAIFFSKCSMFNLDVKNAIKGEKKFFF